MCPLIKDLAIDCLETRCNYYDSVKGCMYVRLQQQRKEDEQKKYQERNRQIHMAISKG